MTAHTESLNGALALLKELRDTTPVTAQRKRIDAFLGDAGSATASCDENGTSVESRVSPSPANSSEISDNTINEILSDCISQACLVSPTKKIAEIMRKHLRTTEPVSGRGASCDDPRTIKVSETMALIPPDGVNPRTPSLPPEQPVELSVSDYEEVLADHRRLVRELDVALNGEEAAPQASLCDIVAQVKDMQRESQQSVYCSTKSALLPCPFCGGEAIIDDSCRHHIVYCTKCGALPDDENGANFDRTRAQAIKYWNRRAPKREAQQPNDCGITLDLKNRIERLLFRICGENVPLFSSNRLNSIHKEAGELILALRSQPTREPQQPVECSELKPCPWCGGNATAKLAPTGVGLVQCDNWDCVAWREGKTLEDAKRSWNTREPEREISNQQLLTWHYWARQAVNADSLDDSQMCAKQVMNHIGNQLAAMGLLTTKIEDGAPNV